MSCTWFLCAVVPASIMINGCETPHPQLIPFTSFSYKWKVFDD